MSNKLYVGGLSYSTTNETLEALFERAGEVLSAQVITDRDTGRSKGFGFVEMQSTQAAADATTRFNGSELDGRTITVNEARAREPRARTRW
ncbi:RNA recognition motif domain-containing protein [Oligoflexus tunisiensis]|uniref:RNA recognition motif domain-containing protein n=1 Tax=Oligoflexus tunisiensis TaxID=708132 RepID=UPI000A91AB3F|nr:RNA-binding protein [Oligoflexus tunisiensis]